MPSRREQIVMTDAEVAAFLDEQRVLNVATNGPSGHPHVVAMWFAMLDGRPSFWTFGKSQKVVNLRRDPRITALVESGESYGELRGVELVGTARIVEDSDETLAIGRAVAAKYQGADAAASPDALAFLEAQARKRVGVVIDVERTVSWDHTKLAGAY
jgi:PPOX class probable F420-dependent enzyme